MAKDINRDYYIGYADGFPEVKDGQVLYDSYGNSLYIDFNGNRNQINKQDTWRLIEEPDPWEEIIANQNYATDYQLGKIVDLDFGGYGIHPMELVAMDADDKADGTGKARMTWISKDIVDIHCMNDVGDSTDSWETSSIRVWLRNEVWHCLPDILQQNIVDVNKTFYDKNIGATNTIWDSIWIPSCREIFGGTSLGGSQIENSGIDYLSFYSNDTNKILKQYSGENKHWWMRTQFSFANGFYNCIRDNVNGNVLFSAENQINIFGAVIGFCL